MASLLEAPQRLLAVASLNDFQHRMSSVIDERLQTLARVARLHVKKKQKNSKPKIQDKIIRLLLHCFCLHIVVFCFACMQFVVFTPATLHLQIYSSLARSWDP